MDNMISEPLIYASLAAFFALGYATSSWISRRKLRQLQKRLAQSAEFLGDAVKENTPQNKTKEGQ